MFPLHPPKFPPPKEEIMGWENNQTPKNHLESSFTARVEPPPLLGTASKALVGFPFWLISHCILTRCSEPPAVPCTCSSPPLPATRTLDIGLLCRPLPGAFPEPPPCRKCARIHTRAHTHTPSVLQNLMLPPLARATALTVHGRVRSPWASWVGCVTISISTPSAPLTQQAPGRCLREESMPFCLACHRRPQIPPTSVKYLSGVDTQGPLLPLAVVDSLGR